MIHYLVVTALGSDRAGIVNQVTHVISECGCNIVDSRLAILGNEFTFTMLLSGEWNALTRLESILPTRSHELNLVTLMKRTTRHQITDYPLRAQAELLIRDEPGIVSQCTGFFSAQGWDLHALRSETLPMTPHDMLHARFELQLPQIDSEPMLAAQFADFCQQLGAEQYEFSILHKPGGHTCPD
ncbi:glycine cleavage system protein R [Pseudaeromonas sharmana]|uniref:Glycine cleavage system transcriptional repressor n=1 Tax=Pseudaeromonas sharmana TaxID=328412 RepID=A0ABV8CJV1_9GAMM